jgi:hypothetical protein
MVNGQLNKQLNVAKQPPDLLDQRDQLLKKLSSYAKYSPETIYWKRLTQYNQDMTPDYIV